MRLRTKDWKNGKYPKWTALIVWFQGEEPADIRLKMSDCEREHNYFPKSVEEANHVWDAFKLAAPDEGVEQPFITDLLELLEAAYPHQRNNQESSHG